MIPWKHWELFSSLSTRWVSRKQVVMSARAKPAPFCCCTINLLAMYYKPSLYNYNKEYDLLLWKYIYYAKCHTLLTANVLWRKKKAWKLILIVFWTCQHHFRICPIADSSPGQYLRGWIADLLFYVNFANCILIYFQ